MQKLLLITISLIYSCLSLAASSYQVDVIVFTNPQKTNTFSELSPNVPLVPVSNKAIKLSPAPKKGSKSYHLLKPSLSGLNNEFYLLSRKSHYQVLGHYSWRQPKSNQSPVALPYINTKGWQIQGTVQVRESNFYLLESDLQCSPPNNPQSSFTVSQKQRIKGSMVYYLDHPQIGMLIKIRKVA